MSQHNRDGRLAGKVAIVTGGGQGIGRGIACAFASESASVAAVDIDADTAAHTAKLCRDRGGDGIAWQTDVSDRAAVDKMVADVFERFGGVDIVVTCALPKLGVRSFESTSIRSIDTMWEVGYLGVVHVMQACLPHLKARRGAVINFGSAAGINAAAGYASYAPVKEAVRALTRVAAREWGPYGIRVNAICPFARSEQFDEWAMANPDQARMAEASSTLGRVGDCEADIGRAAVFLASDEAGYINGHSLMVDGGQGMPL